MLFRTAEEVLAGSSAPADVRGARYFLMGYTLRPLPADERTRILKRYGLSTAELNQILTDERDKKAARSAARKDKRMASKKKKKKRKSKSKKRRGGARSVAQATRDLHRAKANLGKALRAARTAKHKHKRGR